MVIIADDETPLSNPTLSESSEPPTSVHAVPHVSATTMPYPLEKHQPPTYTASTVAGETQADPPVPTIPIEPSIRPCKFLSIHQSHSPVVGRWRVDTNLVVPRSILTALEQGENPKGRPHLSLYSSFGRVNAEVELVGGDDRVLMKAESQNGDVSVKITNPANQRLDLFAKSSTGSVNIYLPRSFHGPITGKTKYGTVKFSSELTKNLMMFSEMDGDKKCFLGQYEGSNFGEDGITWEKDECYAETWSGRVKFWYIDEDTKLLKSLGADNGGKGFWRKLFS